MEKHVKIIGWLWVVNGVLGIIVVLPGLAILNLTDSIPNAGDAVLVTLGSLCFFLPGIIADFAACYGLLKFQSWARILAIILAFFNLVFMCWMIIPAVVSIYTLVILFNQETVALFKDDISPTEIDEFN